MSSFLSTWARKIERELGPSAPDQVFRHTALLSLGSCAFGFDNHRELKKVEQAIDEGAHIVFDRDRFLKRASRLIEDPDVRERLVDAAIKGLEAELHGRFHLNDTRFQKRFVDRHLVPALLADDSSAAARAQSEAGGGCTQLRDLDLMGDISDSQGEAEWTQHIDLMLARPGAGFDEPLVSASCRVKIPKLGEAVLLVQEASWTCRYAALK